MIYINVNFCKLQRNPGRNLNLASSCSGFWILNCLELVSKKVCTNIIFPIIAFNRFHYLRHKRVFKHSFISDSI